MLRQKAAGLVMMSQSQPNALTLPLCRAEARQTRGALRLHASGGAEDVTGVGGPHRACVHDQLTAADLAKLTLAEFTQCLWHSSCSLLNRNTAAQVAERQHASCPALLPGALLHVNAMSRLCLFVLSSSSSSSSSSANASEKASSSAAGSSMPCARANMASYCCYPVASLRCKNCMMCMSLN